MLASKITEVLLLLSFEDERKSDGKQGSTVSSCRFFRLVRATSRTWCTPWAAHSLADSRCVSEHWISPSHPSPTCPACAAEGSQPAAGPKPEEYLPTTTRPYAPPDAKPVYPNPATQVTMKREYIFNGVPKEGESCRSLVWSAYHL